MSPVSPSRASSAWRRPGAVAQGTKPDLGHGQTLSLADPNSFQEILLDQPPTSRGIIVGASIVGIRLDGPARKYDPQDVRVVLGGEQPNDLLCVRFLSRDGRYSAQGRYKLGQATPADPVLEVKTAFEKQLAGYRTSDIAILAQSAKACDATKNSNLFAVDLGASDSGDLIVQLNAGDARVRAQIGQNNAAVSDPVVCIPPAGEVHTGFTQECRLHLRGAVKPGLYQLSIGETASTGEIAVKTYGLTLYRTTAAAP